MLLYLFRLKTQKNMYTYTKESRIDRYIKIDIRYNHSVYDLFIDRWILNNVCYVYKFS